MLKRIRSPHSPSPSASSAKGGLIRVGVVASEYNRKHVDSLLDGALGVLRDAGAEVDVVRVPGAFEIPLVAEILAGGGQCQAVLCLGVIIRGETAHADLVGESVTGALMEIGLRHRIPVIHEVLLVADTAQADVRCLQPEHNRGVEAAGTALSMIRIVGRMKRSGMKRASDT
ncbi:MAG: 6,7-dimethyl-8-ribityllumazine synthase [Limisphaerales bacterium]